MTTRTKGVSGTDRDEQKAVALRHHHGASQVAMRLMGGESTPADGRGTRPLPAAGSSVSYTLPVIGGRDL